MKWQRDRILRSAALMILLLSTVLVYRGVTSADFVFDDQGTVVHNRLVWSLSYAKEWFVSPYAVTADRGGKNYRPVTVASYGIDYAAWGGRPTGFHVTNLAIHLIVVAVVYVLGRRLWRSDVSALVAATWMALHPVNAEAVNYISARSSTLAALGVLVAIWCYDRWFESDEKGRNRSSSGWLVAALGSTLFALGAKESAAVLPVLIIAWDRARRADVSSWHASVKRSIPFWVVLGCWLMVRHAVIGENPGPSWDNLPDGWLLQWVAFSARIIATAGAHSVWPVGLAADYGWPYQLEARTAIGACLAAAAVGAGAVALGRMDRRIAWCWVWIAAALLPPLALPYFTRLALYQEHRIYLAEIGVAWVAGGLGAWVSHRLRDRTVLRQFLPAVAASFVVAAVWVDLDRTWVWGDSNRLWGDVLAKYPDSAIAHMERGVQQLKDGALDDAESELLAALRIVPSEPTYLNLGEVYRRRKDFGRAIEAYRSALVFNARNVDARILLGRALQSAGRTDEALAEFEQALRDAPWAGRARLYTAEILEQRGRVDEALQHLALVPPDDRIYDEAQVRLGGLLLKLERWADARRLFEAFAARKPKSSAAKYYIGMTHVREGRDALAEAALREAVTLDPRDGESWRELAALAVRHGRWNDARQWAERSLALDQSHLGAHATAALAAERLGDADGAIRHYRVLAESPTGNPAADAMRAEARSAIARLSTGTGGSGRPPKAMSRS